jgi:hypothetical protein
MTTAVRKFSDRFWHSTLTSGFKREQNTPESVKFPSSCFVPWEFAAFEQIWKGRPRPHCRETAFPASAVLTPEPKA